ncbi:hypothetical protein OAB00_01675 [Akkermansiaceae bacterium]|nr:hypothetical protein [Akkermansiaceae bacterium]
MNEISVNLLVEVLTQLGGDTYGKMCNDREDKLKLETLKIELSKSMLTQSVDTLPSRALIMAFLKACRLHSLYRASVGDHKEILSTLDIETLPLFKVDDNPSISKAVNQLAQHWQLSPHDLAELEQQVQSSEQKLNLRHKVVDWLRNQVTDNLGQLNQNKVQTLFEQLFPNHPLQPEQIHLVATRTGLYWSIPKKGDTPEQQTWLKQYDRFSFNRFNHFPMFSGFEIRDANDQWLKNASQTLGFSLHETIERLNSVITMERTEDIEKFLIHDTWGHVWQADLANFRDLYDEMESMRRPMEASVNVAYTCGNTVCLADLYFPNKNQEIVLKEEEAVEFIHEWLAQHSEAVMTPLVAELTADIVEYKFLLDNPAIKDKLPSSSVFQNDPAKLDFAWVDLSYFARELKRIHHTHFHSEAFLNSFNHRLQLLLRDRYKNRIKDWSDELLLEQVSQCTKNLFEKFESIQNSELSNEISALSSSAKQNTFFTKLISLLYLQTAANDYIDNHLQPNSAENGNQGLFEMIVLFIGISFCQRGTQPFTQWSEELRQHLPNMMDALGEKVEPK